MGPGFEGLETWQSLDPRYHRAKKTDISPTIAGAVSASRVVLSGGNVVGFAGWSLRETTGTAAAVCRFHDGANVATEVLATVALASAASAIYRYDGQGVECATGRIFLEIVSGSIEGVVYWIPALGQHGEK